MRKDKAERYLEKKFFSDRFSFSVGRGSNGIQSEISRKQSPTHKEIWLDNAQKTIILIYIGGIFDSLTA